MDSETDGTRHSEVHTTSTESVVNQGELIIGQLNGNIRNLRLVEQLQISQIEVEFEVKAINRRLAELQIEKAQMIEQLNRLVSQHNGLIQRYQYLKAAYLRAETDLDAHYLANPAYRLLRDHKTEVANYHLRLAAQQAYLTGVALQYWLGGEIPNLTDVYKVRHTSHLQWFLTELNNAYLGADEAIIDERTLSLRELASGITDDRIAAASPEDRIILSERQRTLFKEFLQSSVLFDDNGNPETLILTFQTSLGQHPFNEEISKWGWRIAGSHTSSTDPVVNARCPIRGNYGVRVRVNPGAQTLPSNLTTRLTQAGQSSIRQQNGTISTVAPRRINVLDSVDNSGILDQATAAAPIKVNSASNDVSAFCNVSVAASSWILEVPLQFNDVTIDWELLNDIKIDFLTFYFP